VVGHRVVVQVDTVAIGVLDGAPVEGQRVGGDADAVVVAVRGLDEILEREVASTSVRREHLPKLRVPRGGAYCQRYAWPPGDGRFWPIESGMHHDGIAEGVHATRWWAHQVHVFQRESRVLRERRAAE
jgi:hypothetical protein